MLNSGISNIKVFACNSNKELAEAIVEKLGLKLGDCEVEKFSDGEISVKINETIRGADVFIIQSTSYPVNDNLMELLIMIDAMKRASAARITAVMPYYGYARQDRKARPRDPISAKLVANLLTSAGANRVLTMDLHCAQIQGFFDIPVDNLIGSPLLTHYYIDKYGDELEKDFVAVSPDLGSVTRVRKFAEKLNIPIAIIDKRRPKANVSEVMNIIGDIEGKRVILVDDMIDTAGTITNAANALKERGALDVSACCTHGVLSGPAMKRLEESAIEDLLVLDTIEMTEDKLIDKISVVSVADVFADAINFVHKGESISSLFD
jgi:ribose-phosphate pyrophosphokinase